MEVTEWPPHSPNLNIIIQCVRDYVKRQKDVSRFTSTQGLRFVLQQTADLGTTFLPSAN